MRFTSPTILFLVLVLRAEDSLRAQDYLTKDGNLAQQLKVVQLRGGFAGYSGMQFTIAPDGTWSSERIFNQKLTPKDKGKLSRKELARLGAILDKYELAKLPAESGKPPGADPNEVTLEFGKRKVSLIGQAPPKLDPKNPTGTAESRFAGIMEGVMGMLTPQPKEEKRD